MRRLVKSSNNKGRVAVITKENRSDKRPFFTFAFINKVVVVLFLVGGMAPLAFAGKVEVKRKTVKVYEKASKSSSVVETLKKGVVLETKERKGMYWEVVLSSGKSGFVSVMGVKRKAVTKDSNISSALRAVAQKGRRDGDSSNIRTRSAVMGVRGLDESSETAFAGNVKPNLRMVYSMENIHVGKKKVRELERLIEKEITRKMEKEK